MLSVEGGCAALSPKLVLGGLSTAMVVVVAGFLFLAGAFEGVDEELEPGRCEDLSRLFGGPGEPEDPAFVEWSGGSN